LTISLLELLRIVELHCYYSNLWKIS